MGAVVPVYRGTRFPGGTTVADKPKEPPVDKSEELREPIRRAAEAIPESLREQLRRAGDAIPQDLRDRFMDLAAQQRKRLEGDEPPKRRPIQYSAPPSRSAGSFGVPRPGPPVPPIPTPVDPASPLPLRETYVPNLAGRPVEQSKRSSEKPIVSEGGPLPKTWREAVPYVVWGVLVLGFGLEFVTALVHAEWLHAIVSFVGLVGLMTAAIHWTRLKTWATQLSPNWIVATFSLLLLAIILAPFVEQRRWPFSTVFHDQPTAEDIAKATAPIQTQLDTANRELQAERQKTKPLIPPGQSIITTSQMAKEVESLRAEINELKQQNDALRAPKTGAPTLQPPVSPPPPYADKTVSQLLDLCINRTALQCPSFFTDEVGKRLNAEGIVRSVWVNGPYIDVQLWTDNRPLVCHFDTRWKERLRTLRAPDNIKITGKIASTQDGSQLYLEVCEFRD